MTNKLSMRTGHSARKIKTPVAIYARSALMSRASIRRQQAACVKLARSIGAKVVARFKDNGVSGLARRRPGLDAMMREACNGKFKGVIIEEDNRLARCGLLNIAIIQQFASADAPVRTVNSEHAATLPPKPRCIVSRAPGATLGRSLKAKSFETKG